MAVFGSSRQSSFAINQESNSWDPSSVLNIINPDTRGFTCVGYARFCGRRCQNPIAQCNRQKVFDMLDEIALLRPTSRVVTSKLPKIAFLSLCGGNHRNQVEEVVAGWLIKISSTKSHPRRTESWRVRNDTNSSDIRTQKATPRATAKAPQEAPFEPPKISAKIRPTQAEEGQWRQESQGAKQREQERLAREKQRKEREEKEKLGREKKDREEKQKREREAQKERIKRAAERRREEEERLKRAEAAREKGEWEAAWKDYSDGWNTFRATKSIPASRICSAIPWPVKDGARSEVKASAVRDFYLKASPDADNPALMFKLMQKESLKWHPDKICSLFRGHEASVADKIIVDMIAKVVIQLRGEAQAKKNG